MKKYALCLVLSAIVLWSICVGDLTNVTKVTELSEDDIGEYSPSITHDGLRICFERNDYVTELFYEASRASTSDPFSNVSSAAFVNVMSDANESNPWMSDDGLRLYFASYRESDWNIYHASRESTGDAFGAPAQLSMGGDSQGAPPHLANNELSIYFMRYHTDYNELYRVTRPTISSSFGTPELFCDLSHSFELFDISEDELTIFLQQGGYLYYAERSSISNPFGTLTRYAQSTINYTFQGGSMSGDLSKAYFSQLFQLFFNYVDIYVGDITLSGTEFPWPPSCPKNLPEMDIPINRGQIGTYTGDVARPYGAACDSQGRFIFFDQKMADPSFKTVVGTNQLIRVTMSGGTPSFETLVTEAQLNAVDSRWTTEVCLISDIAMLSDDSILLAYKDRIVRIVPGSPPAITTVVNFNLTISRIYDMAVDQNSSPNKIYILGRRIAYSNYGIAVVNANQTNVNPSSIWYSLEYYYDEEIWSLVADGNGDLFLADETNMYLFDTDTKTSTTLFSFNLEDLLYEDYERTVAMDINPITGDIFGAYSTDEYPYPNIAIFKITDSGGSIYSIVDHVLGEQCFEDPGVEIWVPEAGDINFTCPARGMAIDPTGSYIYYCNGSKPPSKAGMVPMGTNCMIRIGTTPLTGLNATEWMKY